MRYYRRVKQPLKAIDLSIFRSMLEVPPAMAGTGRLLDIEQNDEPEYGVSRSGIPYRRTYKTDMMIAGMSHIARRVAVSLPRVSILEK